MTEMPPLPVAELKTLGTTVNGDVFYLAADPSCVYLRDGNPDQYLFMEIQDDIWRLFGDVGVPDEAVVVVHNIVTGKAHAAGSAC